MDLSRENFVEWLTLYHDTGSPHRVTHDEEFAELRSVRSRTIVAKTRVERSKLSELGVCPCCLG